MEKGSTTTRPNGLVSNCARQAFFTWEGFGFMARSDQLVDIRPPRDIHRREVVSETRESADQAGENHLIWMIGLIDTSAMSTGSI
jgi:alkanesulfonate monooxygenase SsuD/methylene tetrahydromethanopterin reductase-like flavin-dependent oxidoreductase (luciferase family)